ncbi:bifunctional adenosylcobinamide kinase/adenosylcobinamide-phosphate guanylyltransferase [Brachymonas sp. G13]|uniref:bifunctional adenosylcobinamide kinase/adenosylcobinamide-phosphate guanylyltransferase n=1 Tax=Brachymonas TaxID=28219 RepID=UPI0016A5C716|nr:bifunctional adenosylcobinamide kinase/adenosylcobinamide-phosphate guanylyltransferase [Brachymonas sp. J145]MEE1653490.1 bifunctional adenosylcobinamide kinase/adenosylcobinamide-phosphate guanylyltransferase [Brachymonas sp. J145]NLX17197.1 bifunctional adenosylcobinamide kinase/adenosylcobinamide-phosphate guanylyltransferase [Ramlibacter sp.]
MSAHHELILGGQKSGKTVRAEQLAAQWLATDAAHRALYLATARPWDAEMQTRIVRHQQERARRVPGMETLQMPEGSRSLPVVELLQQHASPDTAIVLDCLTLWLTQQLMPLDGDSANAVQAEQAIHQLLQALREYPGPLYIVSNEIGLGVIPLGRETRAFVDSLGSLNQRVAADCSHVTLMAAGLPLILKSTD